MTLHYITGGASPDLHHPVLLQPPQPPWPAAPSGDPSLLLGKLCEALQAGPDAYNTAAAVWRAKFPLAALPDPRKDFLICEGGSGRAERMGAPPTFPGHLPSTWQCGFAQTYHITREIECWR